MCTITFILTIHTHATSRAGARKVVQAWRGRRQPAQQNPNSRCGLFYPMLHTVATGTCAAWIQPACRGAGVTGVVNLCEEFRGYPRLYRQLGIEQLCLPTTDYCTVSEEHVARGVAFIDEQIRAGGSVFVHCKSGVGRSAMVLVTYLAKHAGFSSVGEANRYAKRFRPTIIGNAEERPSIRRYMGLDR
mmetsp:Transcript_86374/g.230713  ORF Transcript_86374/g.230713 Transcript_86374/m.230713 type:complete len:188 (-) Transcript_86374:410-973(-)